MKLQQHDRITATFSPTNAETLRAGIEAWIGWRGEWLVGWIIEDGTYQGQYAMIPVIEINPGFSWVPECDLSAIVPLDDSTPDQ